MADQDTNHQSSSQGKASPPSSEHIWISKKQIAKKYGRTVADVEALVTLGYLHPIRRVEGGFLLKSQRIHWTFYLKDVIAGINAFKEKASPPAPTDPVSTRQKYPWEV